MTEVVHGPIKPPTSDWRWREILDLEPFQVMEELAELDTNLFAARSELKEAARELADLEDRLYRAKQGVLEGLRGSLDQAVDQSLIDHLFKGGTKDERKERQEMYLSSLDWVQQAGAEIKVARERKDNAQVAFDSLLDRQTNLGKFANMYSATARLLATVRVSETFEERLFFVGEGKDPYSVICKDDAEKVAQRAIAVKGCYSEVGEATYLAHRDAWVRGLEDDAREGVTEPLAAPPVLIEEDVLAGLAAIGVEATEDYDEGEEEGKESPFPPDVAAAVNRYSDLSL